MKGNGEGDVYEYSQKFSNHGVTYLILTENKYWCLRIMAVAYVDIVYKI